MIGFAHRAKGGAVLGGHRGCYGPFGTDDPHPSTALRLVPRSYTHPDARALLRALYAERVALHGFADRPDATEPRDFEPPEGLFVLAYDGPTPIACGGWRTLPGRTAELAYLFVVPEHRDRGHGRRLLATLERTAAQAGARRLVAGSDTHTADAFAAAGFTPCDPHSGQRDGHAAVDRVAAKPLPSGAGTRPLSAPRR
ncbi:GNAT family N-acetyltransferase [Embleya sp. NPDC008237]|uniref:GNAT family N-acetyltransferase n=1 Tax=Embleya sp. NPDC008237 TaxID=3363978 RepID=UPI0036EE52E7